MNSSSQKQYPYAFTLLTSLFFMWGFITVMNDLLINNFKKIFELSAFQSSLVQSAFFGAYFVVSLIYFLVSWSQGQDPINKMGYKKGMVYSLLTCGAGALLFLPAAQLESYPLFLTALFVLAAGVTLLQICANPYAAILGRSETASSRLNLAQGFNSLGTTVGPLVGAVLIYQLFSDGQATASSVGSTYVVYGLLFWLAALLVALFKMPEFKNPEKVNVDKKLFQFPQLTLGIFAIFFYVGAEVSIGSYIIPLAEEPQIMDLSSEAATYYLAFYWGGAMIGRLMGAVSLNQSIQLSNKLLYMALISIGLFSFIYVVTGIEFDEQGSFQWNIHPLSDVYLYLIYMLLNYIGFILGKSRPARTLAVFSSIIILLLIFTVTGSGAFAFWAILGVGLFNSIMWSNIFTLAIKNLGKYTSLASSLLIMAVVGGALIPPLQGLIADQSTTQFSYILPIACYAFLTFYGITQSRKESRT